MAIKFFNDLTIPGVITDSTLTLGDAFIKWDSANTILRIDGTGTYDGIYIGDPSGDAIIFEGTDMSLSSSTGDAGAYAINNATGGSLALQLKAGTAFNSTIEVPEASGTIALTTDLDGSGGTLSNYLPLAGGTMTGLANIDMDGGQITNISYLNSPSGNTDGWDGITGRFLEAEDTFTAPGFRIDASQNVTFDGGAAGGVFLIDQTNIQISGTGGEIFIEINNPVGSADTTDIIFRTDGGVYTNTGTLSYDGPNTTGDRTWTFPDASGILALTSDITANGIYDGSGNLSTDTVISMSDIASPSTEFKLRFDNTLAETVLSIDPTINSVGIGTSTPAANLNVVGDTADSVVFKVDGTVGELFTITDSLTGVLFSVNNISGLPIFEVEDTDEIRMGNYLAPSGYTTGRGQVTSTGDTIIHTVDISSYTMVIFEYTVSDGTNSRAATITAVTDGASVQSTETGITPDIGTTADITMSVTLDASPAELNLVATTASTTGWNVKTIVRTI